METNQDYNYEDFLLDLDNVMDLIESAAQNHAPLSLSRYGHGEIAYMGWPDFQEWKDSYDTYSLYSGATVSVSRIQNDLFNSLRTADIVGFHVSWGQAREDREAAGITRKILQSLDYRPKWGCSAFITHEMINSDRFWKCIRNYKVALVGRRAYEAVPSFREKGVDIVYTIGLEGYEEIDKVCNELSERNNWDIALISAGIPATVLAPMLAIKTNKVVVDFGHALDKFIDKENFNFQKLVDEWTHEISAEILVSVIIAVYNGEIFIREALDSVLSQTYANIEVIIVNDGSTDSTKAILDSICDTRVQVIHLEENQGAANALNIGISHAKGSWIAIQDADDRSYPTRIEEQIKYVLNHPELAGVGTFIECIPGSADVSNNTLRAIAGNKNWYNSRERIKEKIYWGNPLTHSSMMFSRSAFWATGGYSTDLNIAYDYDLWLKLLEKGEIENVPKVLVQYRIYKESLSNKDCIATVREIQIASSRAIYRLFKGKNISRPKVIVVGSEGSCINYSKFVAPYCGLNLEALIYKNIKYQLFLHRKRLEQGKINAVIVLEENRDNKLFDEIKSLKLNKQIFYIYSWEGK